MKLLIGIISLIHLSAIALAQPANYGFGKQITIQASQVAGTVSLVDFPLLVSFTDPNLRSQANGGNVQNINGYDVVFTSDNCGTRLDHQIEKYDPTTGEYIAWVRIPLLDPNTNTDLHMYYGNSTITVNPSSTAVWASNAAAVYHLSNDDFSDASGNGMHATNNATGNVTGKIGDARSFNGTNQYLRISEAGTTSLDVTELTMTAWIFPTNYNVPADRGMILNKESAYEMGLQDNTGAFQAASQPGCWRWAGTSIIPLSTWTKVSIVFSGGVQRNYVNGTLIETFPDCSNPLVTNDQDMKIGARGGDAGLSSYFIGNIDEVKVSNRAETAAWIETEYNNQNAPATFYTVSAQMTANNVCILLPMDLDFFDCVKERNNQVKIDWQTSAQINNDYFVIERSADAISWEEIAKVDGAGTTTERLSYSYIDQEPYEGNSYYRLKQVDFDGETAYSTIKTVAIFSHGKTTLQAYPNPVRNELTLTTSVPNAILPIAIFNTLGEEVTSHINWTQASSKKLMLDLSRLDSGLYYLKTKTSMQKIYKQ